MLENGSETLLRDGAATCATVWIEPPAAEPRLPTAPEAVLKRRRRGRSPRRKSM